MSSFDVLNVCRLCLNEEFLENIFNQEDLERCISEHLSIVVSENDTLSHFICTGCLTQLHSFRDFRLRCIDVQNVLHSMASEVMEDGFSLLEMPPMDSKNESTSDSMPMLQPVAHNGGNEFLLNAPTETNNTTEQTINAQETLPQINRRKCQICGKLVRYGSMQDHLNIHNGVRPYYCERGCKNKSFSHKSYRNRHYTSVHSEKTATCQICSKVYASQKHLIDHRRIVHKPKPFLCPVCSKRFVTRNRMETHMKFHENEANDPKSNLEEDVFIIEEVIELDVDVKAEASES